MMVDLDVFLVAVGVTVAVRANPRGGLATRGSPRRATKGGSGEHLRRGGLET